MNDVILQAHDLHKSYQMGQATLQVLRGVSLSVRRGEFLAVMGSSGCGKSTLLHILGGLDAPNSGDVHFNGTDVYACPRRERDQFRNQHIGFVFQFYHLLPELNVFENVLLPRLVESSVMQWAGRRKAASEEIMQVLDQVGLSDRILHRPDQLSGGERQRAAIARAMANHPTLLLADEPTGNLDQETGKKILAVLTKLNERGQTIIMVTHDPNIAALAHRCVQLTDGRLQTG